MFQKILKKLTALNSFVFLLLFIIFGTIVLGYTAYSLFDRIDDSMRLRVSGFKIVNGRLIFQQRFRLAYDPRVILLVRNAEGQFFSLFPVPNEELDDILEAAAKTNIGQLRSIKHEGHTYRILSEPYQGEDNQLLVGKELVKVREVIAVGIVDAEVALLDKLLKIFVAGLIIGTTVIFFAGYYLARRALVPIRSSWEKQQQFVADASHELRSPLTVIQSNTELILRHPNHSVEEESKRITNILREVMRMNKLVSALLTLARADANKAEMNIAPLVLNHIIEAVCEQFRSLAEIKDIRLSIDTGKPVRMTGDKERIYQMLVALLDNAFKFTPERGQISIKCYAKSNYAHIEVQDTGRGIPAEDLPRIFDRFFRGDKARSRETGGTGLGLAIAKWIIEKHGGKVKVESQIGAGTRFHISLPVKKQ